MVSEIDLLREDIPRLEMKFGANNPFVEVLKTQLASLQNQAKQQPQGAGIIGGLLILKGFKSGREMKVQTTNHNAWLVYVPVFGPSS